MPTSSPRSRSWSGCDAGTAVVFHRIEGGGHTWPGGPQYASPDLIGTTNRDLAASEEMWAFFAAHPREAAE